MSIKIYNGYRFDSADLKKIMPMLARLGRHYQEVCRTKIAVVTAEIAAGLVDDNAMGRLDKEIGPYANSPFLHAYNQLDKRGREIKRSERRDPVADFCFDLTIIPRTRDSLMLLYTEQPEFMGCLRVVPGVEPFPYWDNTDKPNDLTERQWKDRGRAWTDAVGDRAPAQVGLTREFFIGLPHFDLGFVDEVVMRMPSLADRVSRIALDQYRNQYVTRHVKTTKPVKPYDSQADILAAVMDFSSHIKTKHGKKEVAKLAVTIRKKLVPTIDRKILTATLCPTKKTRPASVKRIAMPSPSLDDWAKSESGTVLKARPTR